MSLSIAFQLLAALVYVLPIAAFTAFRTRRGESPAQIATDIPLAIALDLMGVLLLARFMRLELASLVSRGLWLVGLALWTTYRVKRRETPKQPVAFDFRLAANSVVLATTGLLFSFTLSRLANIWDREWHIPLVTSLRGQRLPFANVYEPRVELAYHYTGDVLASMLQTFSFDTMHSALALSLAHDLMFAALGVVVACTLAAAGIRRLAVQASVFLAMILAGPMTFAQDPQGPGGYSIGNLLSMSYRPHVSLAYVLIVGFAAAMLAGIYRSKIDLRARVFPALLATSAVLVITDEITLVLLGLCIGVTWLYDPASLARTRRAGAVKLGLLVIAIGASILIFGGTLGLHSERYPMWLVQPRAPGWNYAPAPLTTALGRSRLCEDMFTVFGVFVASIGIALSARRRETRTVAVSFLVVGLAATFGLTCVDFNHQPLENHRWVTLAFLFAPLLAALMLAEPDPPGSPRRAGGLAALLIYVSCALGAASSIDWLWNGAGLAMRRQQLINGQRTTEEFYHLNCRETTGAHWFESPTPTYVEERGAFEWVGCRPTFVSGPTGHPGDHKIKVGWPNSGLGALDDVFGNMLERSAPVRIGCIAHGGNPDHICAAARAKGVGECQPSGSDYVTCTVPSARRQRLRSR